MKLRIAFYTAQWGKPVDTLIAGWTAIWNWFTPAYSHVEIGFEVNGQWIYFSSTMRGTASGTRWIKEEELLKNPERWDIYDLEPYRNIEKMNTLAHRLVDLKCEYDFLGIAGFVIPFARLNDKDKWYCSEACWYVYTGVWKKRISPRRMYAILRDFNLIRKI